MIIYRLDQFLKVNKRNTNDPSSNLQVKLRLYSFIKWNTIISIYGEYIDMLFFIQNILQLHVLMIINENVFVFMYIGGEG